MKTCLHMYIVQPQICNFAASMLCNHTYACIYIPSIKRRGWTRDIIVSVTGDLYSEGLGGRHSYKVNEGTIPKD